MRERWSAWAESGRGKRVMKALRTLFVAGIVAFLAYEFTEIGWREIWASMPEAPLFYVLLVGMYLLLPMTEGLIYSRIWKLRLREALAASLKKRVLNQDVLGYSGEVYLYLWAKDRAGLPQRTVLGTIKDNLLVSSVASIATAALLLGGFLLAGEIDPQAFVEGGIGLYVLAGVLLLALLASAAVRFRRALFTLPAAVLGWMLLLHASRFLVGWVLQVVQWWSVVPEAPFRAWAVLLAVMVLTNRIPFLPSSDLVFVGLGVKVAATLGVPVSTVAAMLLVRSVFEKTLNFSFFLLSSLWSRRRGLPDPEAVPAVLPAEPAEAA